MGAGRDHEGSVHRRRRPPDAAKSPLEQMFRDPITGILNLESVRPPLLRSLYALLSNLSSRTSVALSYQEEIHKLSGILFRNLEDRFEQYFISVRKISHSTSPEKNALPLDFCDQVEELTLLLRCCLTILTWPGFDQNQILEKSKFLLDVLRRLISFNVSKEKGKQFSISKKSQRKRTYDEDGYTTSVVEDCVTSLHFLEPKDPCCSSLGALLEVYADELLAAESLRNCFVCVESAVSQNPLFKFNVSSSEIELALEVLCAHLILLASDEQAVENALDRLNRQYHKGFRVPELGVSAALNLLLHPVFLSAPQLFQAHLALLVSETIDADMSRQHMGLHIREIDCYLIAFEKSLHMYNRHVSSYWDDKPPDARDSSFHSCPQDRSLPSFRSCIMLMTGQKLDTLDAKAQTLWAQHMQNKTLESEHGLLSASIAYIEENADVVGDTCRGEVLPVLVALTSRSFSDTLGDGMPYIIRGGNPRVVYLLSSILRLMSNSMSRIIWCLRHGGNKDRLNELEDFSSCRGYDLLLGAMLCSQQLDFHLPVQSSLCKMLEAHPVSKHKVSYWMLVHFSGLLSLSFVSGFDFLVKSCLSVMLALLNLIVFEEGNLTTLKSLLDPDSEPSAFGHPCGDEEATAEQQSSEKRKKSSQIASTFLKFQRRCPGVRGELGDHVESVGLNEKREENCSGEVFLKCLVEGSQEDYDDLVDFVEFDKGKDYFLWSKNRQKYRRWRLEKTAVFRYKRKKMAMRMMNRRKRL